MELERKMKEVFMLGMAAVTVNGNQLPAHAFCGKVCVVGYVVMR